MRFAPDQLRDKALYALEEALQEIRFRKARQTAALRFVLAYLWCLSDGTREPYNQFWKALGERFAATFSIADLSIDRIYGSLGMVRDQELSDTLWRKAYLKYVGHADGSKG